MKPTLQTKIELWLSLLLVVLGLGGGPAAAQGPGRGIHKNYENRGVVYKRIDPTTGKEYVGQAKSLERYEARKGEHAARGGVNYEFRELSRPLRSELDMVESTYIRRFGLEKDGGTLENGRQQMRTTRHDSETTRRRTESARERAERRAKFESQAIERRSRAREGRSRARVERGR